MVFVFWVCSLLALGVLGAWEPLDAQSAKTGSSPQLKLLWEKGSLEGPDAFGSIGHIALAQGAVIVSDSRTLQLTWYSRDGQFVRTLGGKGGAPGEFRRISGVTYATDTLFVIDATARRVTLYLEGHLVSTRPIMSQQQYPVETLSAALPGGRQIVTIRDGSPGSITHGSGLTQFVLVTDGRRSKLGDGNLPRRTLAIEVNGQQTNISAPHLARIADGAHVAQSSNGHFWVLAKPDYENRWIRFDLVDLRTLHRRNVDVPFTPQPVRRSSLDSIARDLAVSTPGFGARYERVVRNAILAQIQPKFLNPVSDLIVSNSGDIWFRGDRLDRTWVLRTRGGTTHRVMVAAAYEEILAADGDVVVTRTVASDGSPRVRLYRVNL